MKREPIDNDLFHLEVFDCLCSASEFTVKGKEADQMDFGEGGDLDPENAEEYGCGNWHFSVRLPTQDVLDKYGITVDEYNTISSALEENLSFGRCSYCS